MPTQLSIRATYGGGLRMTATNGSHAVVTDYPLSPDAELAGQKPLELLLSSLAACAGSTIGLFLTRARQPLQGLEVDVQAQRRDEHPTVLTSIAMVITIQGEGIESAVVERVIAQAERICPVWAMLAPATPITTRYEIVETARKG